MDVRVTRRSSYGIRRLIALLFASAALVASLACATPTTQSERASVTESRSRCAPGAVLDDRHGLCNGRSGRWW